MHALMLGELIEKLEQVGKYCDDLEEKHVLFDFSYHVPGRFVSYRGYYEDLCLTYHELDYEYWPRINAFIQQVNDCVGATFTGYKGGNYKMNKGTRIWVDKTDQCFGTALVGVREYDTKIILETGYIDT